MRVYTIVSATLLLLIGIIGFAFQDQNQAPAYLLLINLFLGCWGIWEIFKGSK